MSKENKSLGSDLRPRSPWQLTPKPLKIADPGSGFKTPNSKLNVSFDKKFCSDYKQVNGHGLPAVGPGADHQLKESSSCLPALDLSSSCLPALDLSSCSPRPCDVSVDLNTPEEKDLGLGQGLDLDVTRNLKNDRKVCEETATVYPRPVRRIIEEKRTTDNTRRINEEKRTTDNTKYKQGLEDSLDLQKAMGKRSSVISFGSRGSGSPGNCSKTSSGIFCRICHDGEGTERLISPCQCQGSVALVHRTCIEKWLSIVNKDTCELCHHKYTITRHPKAFTKWLCEPAVQDDQRNLLGDLICFLLLTPLAAISTYLCASGAAFYLEEKKSESVGLICLCVALVLIYIIWVLLTLRYHIQVWYVWRESNQDIRLTEVGRDPISRKNWRTNNNYYHDVYQTTEKPEEPAGTAAREHSSFVNLINLDPVVNAPEPSQEKTDVQKLSSFGQDCYSRDPRFTPYRSSVPTGNTARIVDIMVTRPLSKAIVSATEIGAFASPSLLSAEGGVRRARSLINLAKDHSPAEAEAEILLCNDYSDYENLSNIKDSKAPTPAPRTPNSQKKDVEISVTPSPRSPKYLSTSFEPTTLTNDKEISPRPRSPQYSTSNLTPVSLKTYSLSPTPSELTAERRSSPHQASKLENNTLNGTSARSSYNEVSNLETQKKESLNPRSPHQYSAVSVSPNALKEDSETYRPKGTDLEKKNQDNEGVESRSIPIDEIIKSFEVDGRDYSCLDPRRKIETGRNLLRTRDRLVKVPAVGKTPPLSPVVNLLHAPTHHAIPLERNDGIIYAEPQMESEKKALTVESITNASFHRRKRTLVENLQNIVSRN